MDAVISFLISFANLISNLVQFLINLVKDLIYVVGLLAKMVVQIPNMIGWLPSACISLVLTLFSIVVIYKVLGREG